MPSTAKKPQDRRPSKKTTTSRPTAEPIPVPEDPNSKYAPNTWLAGGVGQMEDLTVPSGQLCLVRRPGLQGLMKAGVLHNMDSLSQVVNEKHLKRVNGKSTDEIDMTSIMSDAKSLDDVMHVMDKVICHCVVKPEIHMTPNDITRRKPNVVYADMVDLMDKVFIFNFVVGGTRDLETFRGGLNESVGSVEAVEDVPDEAE